MLKNIWPPSHMNRWIPTNKGQAWFWVWSRYYKFLVLVTVKLVAGAYSQYSHHMSGLGWAGLGWAGLSWAGLGWAGGDCENHAGGDCGGWGQMQTHYIIHYTVHSTGSRVSWIKMHIDNSWRGRDGRVPDLIMLCPSTGLACCSVLGIESWK